jgi:signal transduction histidine kinase
MRVAGVPRAMSAMGERTLSGLTLNPAQNNVDIDFASIGFRVGARIVYQYRLAANSEWSAPTAARNISFAALAPGSYRFQVRAVSDGMNSTVPAEISFEVLPPLWRRWWALLIVSGVLAVGLYAAHRASVINALEMEKVRTRIAMDLHDDIGSSLSQISILSEVARREGGNGSSSQSLARVAAISRDLTAALGEIVWAVNPRRDRVGDLVQRIRRFGEDMLGGHGIQFDCRADDESLSIGMPADARRDLFLIFKECTHNVIRHANASTVIAELKVRHGRLQLIVRDDGHGIDGATESGGHGLTSMRGRAQRLGGSLEVDSAAERGTEISVSVPIKRHYLHR